jgi:ParB family chromosome partitioning protein
MAKKPGLGRGLDALIPSSTSSTQINQLNSLEIPIENILPNPHQPRTILVEEDLKDLADSIREHGIIQPLLVIPENEEGKYILIAGERRLRAAKLAGLEKVPVIIRKASEQEHLELALIENLQRENL